MEVFYKNLEQYKPYETEAAKRIEGKFNKKVIKWCNTNRYDFKTEDDIKYEVKTEPSSLKTNNFFIEFEGYKKPSGISVTKSNYYIISDTINFYLIPTHKLKELIENNTFKIVSTFDKLTFGYLINKHIIIQQSILI
jgi:hypothetical protein